MQNAMKNNSPPPPPPLLVRERLRKRRYLLRSTTGILFHHSRHPRNPATITGIPIKRSSQKIVLRMKFTRLPIVQRLRVLGTKPVDCACPASHQKTQTAPTKVKITAATN